MGNNIVSRRSLLESYQQKGYVLITGLSPTTSNLVDLAQSIGQIIHHTRSDQNGIVDVRPDITNFESSQFRGLGRDKFEYHTDGTYTNPPATLLMQMVKPADSGGLTVLFDTQPVLSQDIELAKVFCASTVTIRRASQASTSKLLLSVAPGKYRISWRSDSLMTPTDEVTAEAMIRFKHYLLNYALSKTFIHLQAGDVLIVDNFRMLHARTAFQGFRHLRRLWVNPYSFSKFPAFVSGIELAI